MILNVGQISLIDLIDMIKRNEVVINRDYQRGSSLWPDSARTYFIDTILEGYPFPAVYLYQSINPKTSRPIKELVDGQQRITTIKDFMDNKFKIGKASDSYAGMYFSDLADEERLTFLGYQIHTSTILSATRPELLEMFRRMNAYTAPLNPQERRHAEFQGKFKWFIVELADETSSVLEEYNILTPKLLSRMGDSEFIADLVVALEHGIVTKSGNHINKLYKAYDKSFDKRQEYVDLINGFFNFIRINLSPLSNTFLMKSYVIHSLFCAYAYLHNALPQGEKNSIPLEGPRTFDPILSDSTIEYLRSMAGAHEEQDEEGEFSVYVKACLSSTTQLPQRLARTTELIKAISH